MLYLFVKPRPISSLLTDLVLWEANSGAKLKTLIFRANNALSIPRAKQEPMAKSLSSGFNLKPGLMTGVNRGWRRRWKANVLDSSGVALLLCHRLQGFSWKLA